MEKLKVKITGIRPLLMHNAAMIDPDNASVLEMGRLQRSMKKLKKDDVEGKERFRRQIERCEWEGSLYWDPEIGLMMPGENLFACIVAGARKLKSGKQAEQAIVPFDDIPVETTNKTKDLDTLYKDKDYSLRKPVRIPPKTGVRIMKVRPKISRWSLTFTLEYDASVLPTADLKESLREAGSLIGLGDWRPMFGRFLVEFI